MVSPWLVTSTSRQRATYQGGSWVIAAVNLMGAKRSLRRTPSAAPLARSRPRARRRAAQRRRAPPRAAPAVRRARRGRDHLGARVRSDLEVHPRTRRGVRRRRRFEGVLAGR
jgi:hypothetical protein